MAYDYSKLLGKIVEVCGTQAEFARRMGWSERTTSLKLNGKIDWKQSEIRRACDILGIRLSDIPVFFYKEKVQNSKQTV